MARTAKDLIGRRIEAVDGQVGKVKDIFFDDASWNVRYVVVDTGSWLVSREVLVSPVSIVGIDPGNGAIMTSLTRHQVEASPPVLSDAPVSRLYEQRLHDHYGWPYYWGGTAFGGPGLYMYPPVGDIGLYPALYGRNQENDLGREERQAMEQRLAEANPHLKSCRDVRGYDIHARDGEIGHVDDFLLDEPVFNLTHVVVDTRNWLPGKKVALDVSAIDHIDWTDAEVAVRLDREQVKAAPLEADVLQGGARRPPTDDKSMGSETLDFV